MNHVVILIFYNTCSYKTPLLFLIPEYIPEIALTSNYCSINIWNTYFSRYKLLKLFWRLQTFTSDLEARGRRIALCIPVYSATQFFL